MKNHLLILSLLFLSTSLYAGAFKCVDKNGKTTFQSIPCPKNTKKKKIKLHKDKNPKLTQCRSSCDNNEQVCLSALKDGMWNSDGGLDICKQEKTTCYVTCVNPKKGKYLKKIDEIERASYENNMRYKKAITDIDEKYKRKKEARELKWKCRDKRNDLIELETNWAKKEQLNTYSTSELGFYRKEAEKMKKFIHLKCE